MTITVVTGLAGSGKSYFARSLPADLLMDDDFFDRQSDFMAALREDRNCVIVEAAFMFPKNRDLLAQWLGTNVPNAQVEWIFFENDLAAANANCERRRDKDPAGHIDQNNRNSTLYVIPDGSRVERIWRGG